LSRVHNGTIDVRPITTALQGLFPSARIVGDKWPDYVFMLDAFVSLPEAMCVMIYRDCRDVASSHLKLARTSWRHEPWIKNADTAEKIANRWVRSMELIECYQDRIHAIRYEDLVRNRQQTFEALGSWLKVDPKGFRQSIVRETNIGKFKAGLSAEEVDLILKIAGPTMRKLGYL
ncbi:MAG: sulfotransferase, partial [Candidatus Binatia bacterium]